MKPKLILFTDDFPFGSGETFIENELPYLEDAFDLTIVSSSNSTEMTRCVAPETHVIHTGKNTPSRREMLSAMVFLLFSPKAREERRDIHVKKNSHYKEFWPQSAGMYFRSKKLYKQLSAEGRLNPDEPCTLYFYWNNYKPVYYLLHRQKFSKWKLYSRIHAHDLYNEHTKTVRQAWKWLNTRLDGLFFLSESARTYYAVNFDSRVKEYSEIARLGVKTPGVSLQHPDREQFLLCSCSRTVPVKRLGRVVNALAEIDDLPIRWVHLGDGEQFEELKEHTAKKLSQKANIQVDFPGGMTNREVLRYYEEHSPDCYILTSVSEGVPVCVMEALSYGMPIIATNVGGLSEMLAGTDNILVKNSDDPEELAQAIRKMYCLNRQERNDIAARNKEVWEQRYCGENNYRCFVERIKSI